MAVRLWLHGRLRKRRHKSRPSPAGRTIFQRNGSGDNQATDKTDSPDFVPAVNQLWPVFWLAVILLGPTFPCKSTVACGQNRQAYSSGGLRRTVGSASPVTGFPFHPPTDLPEDTIE